MDCSKCVFNIMDDGPPMSGGPFGGGQVGCKVGRLQKFIDKGKAKRRGIVSTSYELTQFCNMYREEECDADKQRYNVMPLFGIVVSITPEDTLEELTEFCRHLESLEYPKEKLKIVLSVPSGLKYAEGVLHLFNMLKVNFIAAELVLHLHNEGNVKDNETFKKLLEATYFVKVGVKDRFNLDVFQVIDDLLNDELKQLCFVENNSICIVLRSVIQQIYYNYESYEKAVEGLKTISMEQNKYEKI